jgi:hypothetical protein
VKNSKLTPATLVYWIVSGSFDETQALRRLKKSKVPADQN